MSECKFWKCKNGHALGRVRRNNEKIMQLVLFRNAVESSPDFPENSPEDVIAILEGYVVNVRCNAPGCSATRTWVPGGAAMRKMRKMLDTIKRGHGAVVLQQNLLED